MSESRWRQIVTGVQAKAGGTVPVRAPARKVIAMALAVDVDPAEAMRAAGMDVSAEALTAMIREVREPREASASPPRSAVGLAEEIERIKRLPLAPADKIRIANALIDLYEEQQRGAAREDSSAAPRLGV